MTNRPGLIVSVDQVAYLRGGRKGHEPDPVHYALQAELGGAAGIRAHLRIDRRDMSEEDISLLNRLVKTSLYLQVSPHQDIVHLVNHLRPHNLILASERRDERAVDTGLDAVLLQGELKGVMGNVDERQTGVYLYIEPELDQVKAVAKLGARGLLINVRDLMVSAREKPNPLKLKRIEEAVRLGSKLGLDCHLAGVSAAGVLHCQRLVPLF